MTTLTIKDLATTTDLDRKAMASVHGGMGLQMPLNCGPAYDTGYKGTSTPGTYSPSFTVDSSTHATQQLFQTQMNATGNGSAVFGGVISAQNSQFGQNNVFVA